MPAAARWRAATNPSPPFDPGPQTKTIHYVMLVPRTIPLALRVPSNLLQRGQTYTIRVIAVDAQGNKTRSEIPFTA